MSEFEPPRVTDDDIDWACDLLGLPNNAFSGADGNDPRISILKSNESLDIEACPGSGKTTLLVAKLAILARKWTDRRRGICVLSHTNVARREIEGRVGNTSQANRLLSYPHFVGTIHGFVNEFLAIPWLHSKPWPVRMIDDVAAQSRRWWKLPRNTRTALENAGYDSSLLKISAADFSVGDVRWGRGGKLATTTPTYQAIQNACRSATEEGFFCHDEMLLWGNELLDQVQGIRRGLRERFPILFIDEVQDNSEVQSALLFRLFTEGDKPVLRQRFGDSNQAIYQHAGETEGATTDQFPDTRIRIDIPKSHRFGQEIADLANPLALQPQGLVGCGPCRQTISSDTSGKCAVFLFDEDNVRHVIATYAQYLLELFSKEELRSGSFTAIGGVHRPSEGDQVPRFVGHYWPEYDHELAAAEPKPSTFRQYIMAGRKLAERAGEAHNMVEKIAQAVLRLVNVSNPLSDLSNRRRTHRYVLELLAKEPELRMSYLGLVKDLAFEQREPISDDWHGKWVPVISGIAAVIGGVPVTSNEAKAFLKWDSWDNGAQRIPQSHQHDNLFRYPAEQPAVQIRLGSIHSVKGETHTATLLLDTFYFRHNLTTLKPWLLKQKSGRGREGKQNVSRLKQHYVAMTRPSHLLCIAMREDAFSGAELDQLKSIPWRIARVTAESPAWL